MASRWALNAASPRRGPRSSRSGRSPRSKRPEFLSPKPPLSERCAPLPSLRSPGPPRPAGAGTDFFWPGRSSPRMATKGRAGLGASTGLTGSAVSKAGASVSTALFSAVLVSSEPVSAETESGAACAMSGALSSTAFGAATTSALALAWPLSAASNAAMAALIF